MEHLDNPFAPGAGSSPPELAGRDEMLRDASTTLRRIQMSAPIRSQIFWGLRGVGKTVMLTKVEDLALELGFETVSVEAHEGKPLTSLLLPPLRKILLRLDSRANWSEKTKLGLRVLKSFMSRFKAKFTVADLGELELGVDPERGVADSGDLESDLQDLLVAIAEAAREQKACICLLIDELHNLTEQEFSALIMALHKVTQRNLPFVMVAAGLPLILGLAGRSKSYAERLFAFPRLGPLTETEAYLALQAPVRARNAEFEEAALAEIFLHTHGYPYFLQQWGYEAWNTAPGPVIRLVDVQTATGRALHQLDDGFFRMRFDRLTRREKEYVFAMSSLGGMLQRSGDIAEKLGFKANSLGPLRSALISKGMIYSPAHGDNAFTVPLFDDFLRRQLASV